MKLLQVALTGLVGFAGFAAAATTEARGEIRTTWVSDVSGKYICTGTNIEHCNTAGSDCSWIQSCPLGCSDTGNGALCVDKAPTHIRDIDKAALQEKHDWSNYGFTIYECRSKHVLECTFQRDEHPPRCNHVIATCDHGCEQFKTGASCRQTPGPKSRRDQASSGSAEKETHECSDDHRGVLSCNYGFCAIKPGDWCLKGYSCRDDCACCRKDGGKTVVADAPIPPKIDHRSEAPCTPGHHDCHPRSNDWLRVCNAKGEWGLSKFCGTQKGYSCCTRSVKDEYKCDGRTQAAELNATSKEKAPVQAADHTTTTVAAREEPVDNQYCYWPGHYGCLNGNVYVCNAHNAWELSAKCEKSSKGEDCCKIGPEIGVAHCVCPADSSNLVEDRGITAVEDRSTTAIEALAGLGTVAAGMPCGAIMVGRNWCEEANYRGLYVCGQDLSWHLVADCGTTSTGFGCCRAVLPGSAWCDCRGLPGGPPFSLTDANAAAATVSIDAGATEATVPTTNVAVQKRSAVALDSISPKSANDKCMSGQKWCETPGWDWVIVCNQNGDWQRHTFCGKTSENYGCCRSSSIPSGYAVCDCTSLPGVPPPLLDDRADAIEELPQVSLDTPSGEPGGKCSPGTSSCRQPFVDGDLLVCGPNGVWQISSHCCGPYTCYDPPGDEQPHCECSPKTENLNISENNLARDIASNDGVAIKTPQPCQMADNGLHDISNDGTPGKALCKSLCSPGTYECRKGGAEIWVCSSDGHWGLSQLCKDSAPCNIRSNGEAHCGARKDLVRDVGSSSDPADQSSAMGCTPGASQCRKRGTEIWTCSSEGLWGLSKLCKGSLTCSIRDNGEAYCGARLDDKAMPGFPISSARSTDAEHPKDGCMPGSFKCNVHRNLVFVCSGSEQWILSAVCEKEGDCKYGKNGEVYCDPRSYDKDASGSANSLARSGDNEHPTETRRGQQDANKPNLCSPGQQRCGDRGFSIYTCDLSGKWLWTSVCPKNGCQTGEHGRPYCGPAKKVTPEVEEHSTMLTVAKDTAISTAKA